MSSANPPDFLGLGGRVCVVTGAGSGIGRAIAQSFAAQGARVAVLDRDVEGAALTVHEIVKLGGVAEAFACDVGAQASVAAAAERCAAAFDPCDILVNNAGVLRPGALDKLTLAEWNAVLSINLTGYFLCAQNFGAQMRGKGKGALVHTASIAATHANANGGAYAVAKAGVAMLSRQLAIEWGAFGIRSNTVSPGMTLTPMTHAAYTLPGTQERRNQAVPAGRIGRPQDIADAVLFLASDRADYITGEDLVVDGGFTRNLLSLVPRVGDMPAQR
jgi:NAD(P)-dependent dehydrogenase (short-subunit alcohol dehydrogenase family)